MTLKGKLTVPPNWRAFQSNSDTVKAKLLESQSRVRKVRLCRKGGDTCTHLEIGLDVWSQSIRPGDTARISGRKTRTRHLSRRYLGNDLNGDCPCLHAGKCLLWWPHLKSRRDNGACVVVRVRESRIHGEGKQVF
jgi:hypothetical protein